MKEKIYVLGGERKGLLDLIRNSVDTRENIVILDSPEPIKANNMRNSIIDPYGDSYIYENSYAPYGELPELLPEPVGYIPRPSITSIFKNKPLTKTQRAKRTKKRKQRNKTRLINRKK